MFPQWKPWQQRRTRWRSGPGSRRNLCLETGNGDLGDCGSNFVGVAGRNVDAVAGEVSSDRGPGRTTAEVAVVVVIAVVAEVGT